MRRGVIRFNVFYVSHRFHWTMNVHWYLFLFGQSRHFGGGLRLSFTCFGARHDGYGLAFVRGIPLSRDQATAKSVSQQRPDTVRSRSWRVGVGGNRKTATSNLKTQSGHCRLLQTVLGHVPDAAMTCRRHFFCPT